MDGLAASVGVGRPTALLPCHVRRKIRADINLANPRCQHQALQLCLTVS